MTKQQEINIYQVISATLSSHPKDCIFIRTPIQMCERVLSKANASMNMGELIDLIQDEIVAAEVYCPHEGINRMPTF